VHRIRSFAQIYSTINLYDDVTVSTYQVRKQFIMFKVLHVCDHLDQLCWLYQF